MSEPAKGPLPETPAPKTFSASFYTAPFYRSVQADGSWGRISPSGLIHLTFFNDCGAMPTREMHDILPDGSVSPEMKLVFAADTDVVRQLEVDVVLSLEGAKAVRDNLQNFIQILENNRKRSQS